MRQFLKLSDAVLEIRRDLTRAPLRHMRGVQQHREKAVVVREAFNYTYTLPIEALLLNKDQFTDINHILHSKGNVDVDAWWEWMLAEKVARLSDDEADALEAFELHPLADAFREARGQPSYLYQGRIDEAGGLLEIASLLFKEPDTRRAYLPIFHPQDSILAGTSTRVPCSLGFHYMLRSEGDTDYLHTTYYMRACDFDTFWLSDVWLAAQMAYEVHALVRVMRAEAPKPRELKLGHFVHNIISFHLIRGEGDAEIY